ncbi:MAG: NYN domain-containing protein [Verrucomicrobiota bacterium]
MVAHILVDGSNLIHAWPSLGGAVKRDKALARERLISRLLVLLPAACERLTVVFDGRGPELVIEHPHGAESVAVIYTPSGVTADDIIEQLVGRSADPAGCLVATGDQAERSTIEASGAAWCSPDELAARVERAGERQSTRVAEISRENRRKWNRR